MCLARRVPVHGTLSGAGPAPHSVSIRGTLSFTGGELGDMPDEDSVQQLRLRVAGEDPVAESTHEAPSVSVPEDTAPEVAVGKPFNLCEGLPPAPLLTGGTEPARGVWVYGRPSKRQSGGAETVCLMAILTDPLGSYPS